MAVRRTSREGRTLRWLVVVPIVGAVLDDVAYVVLIASQSERPPDIFTVPFVAAFIALTAAMLALSLAGSPLVVKLRPALRAGAAVGLIVDDGVDPNPGNGASLVARIARKSAFDIAALKITPTS